jgi:hypothetical protein
VAVDAIAKIASIAFTHKWFWCRDALRVRTTAVNQYMHGVIWDHLFTLNLQVHAPSISVVRTSGTNLIAIGGNLKGIPGTVTVCAFAEVSCICGTDYWNWSRHTFGI